MRRTDEEAELLRVIRRYVTPDQRYLKLGGALLCMSGRERAKFIKKLGKAAGEISPHELDALFDGGWRGRKTAAWLIAVAGRTEFRDRLGDVLLAGETPYTGQAYCIALATFGTPADADLLAAYLDHYLPRSDLDHDQTAALGALLLLDAKLGTEHALSWTQQPSTAPTKNHELRSAHCAPQKREPDSSLRCRPWGLLMPHHSYVLAGSHGSGLSPPTRPRW